MAAVAYVGTNKGVIVLRSDDGVAWRKESQALQSWQVPMVAVSPLVPNKAFAGTRGDGVWVTEDFGASWKKPSYGRRGPGKVRSVAVAPNDANKVYAGTEPIDLFVSEDGAANWRCLDSVWDVPWVSTVDYPPGRPTTAVEPHVRDIAVDPKDPNTIVIALQVGFMLKSTDGGKSWSVLNKGVDADVHSVAIDPANPKRMWVATGGDNVRAGLVQGAALYKSEDGGQNWGPMAMEFGKHEYSIPLVVNPARPSLVFSAVGTGAPSSWAKRPEGADCYIIRSNDSGESWQSVGGALAKSGKDFAPAIAVDPQDPNRVYVAFRNGALSASEDGGESWRSLDIEVPDPQDMKIVHV